MINFVLKEKKEGKKSAVSALISGEFLPTKKNDRIKIALGISVTPETFGVKENNFTFDENHIHTGRSFDANQLRDKVNGFKKKHDLLSNYYALSGDIPTKEEYENKLTDLLLQEKIIQKKGFEKIDFENIGKHYFDEFLDELIKKEYEDYNNGIREIALKTIKIHENIKNHFLNYQEFKGERIYIEDIKVKTLLEVVDVANEIMIGNIKLKNNHGTNQNKTRNKAGYSVNFTNNMLGQLKAFLRRVDSDEVELSINLSDSRLKKKRAQPAKKIYHDLELLEKIYNYQPKEKRTIRAKEYILLASTFGMRHQSVNELRYKQPQLITTKSGESFYVVENHSEKTGITILSPVFAPALEIYQKYKNNFPFIIQANYISKCLRELFDEMNIKDKTTLNEWVYGVGVVTTEAKIKDVVSSHDCRKTFVTNLLQLGVNSSIVRSMTHENIEENSSSFNIYDNASAIDRAITFYEATKNLNSVIYQY
ncbi:hypothetical protein [Empedobacter sp. 189-2]|uniref:hypothetical protein n=1 Tax=Empedobacter sp. 189-2 TaxID=2746724 RepID=UPI0025760451|nr:hypothetical protein [Empedobacter sp. 189-2]MDM1542342.1 hypothetical protein [Empedobacter sp. 189-2]